MSENQYFAAKEAKVTADTLLKRAHAWYNQLYTNGYLGKVRDMWMAYHGCYYTTPGSAHKISFSGEQGELVNLAVNHIRNIAQHILVMITSQRPAMQARATNADYKSIVQTKLAEGLLDYYMREKRLEKYLRTAVEYAIVFGTGYIKISWNATSGEVYEISEETGSPIYEGDVEFKNLSPYDVVFDMSKETAYEQDWVLCRTFKNKFDLAAKFPEEADRIKGLQTKSDLFRYRMDLMAYDDTDDVPVYEFYHRRTESMPDGRYLLFLERDIVLMDTPMPYRSLPVYRIAPSEILGTPYGYTPLFDLLPIQDAVNSLYSTVLTNQHAFGTQNIWVPEGANISLKGLEGGLNILQGQPNMKPEPLNLTQTPAEIFNSINMFERLLETLSGVNSVARGNPEASLKSGAALALVQSQALQFISGLQQQYVQLVEDVGTGMINMLKDFAAVPRVAMIVGKSNASYIEKEFSGDDLSQVNRVIVEIGNPLSKCLAKDTPVLMFDGSTKMVQDVVIGDEIMGPDSKKRTVSNVNSGKEMMYEIVSKDKNQEVKYGCNESHILTLRYCSDDYRYKAKKGEVLDISVRDYLKLTDRQKRLLQGFKTGVEFTEKSVEIPSYILGLWLGDGHSEAPALTSMDDVLVNEWCDYAKSLNLKVRVQENAQPNKSKVYFITSGEASGKSDRNQFKNHLRGYELINNKHIPKNYLINSRKERLLLLAGLIDTDGTLVSDKTFIITQKSEKLTKDIVFLSRSLGFRTTFKQKTNKDGYVYYRVSIGGNIWEIPTKLERKQIKNKNHCRNWLNYGIEVKPVGEGTYYGFTLKEEPHFVLGDFSVTHNTTAGKLEMAREMMQYGIVKNPEDFFSVLETGRLDVLTDETYRELMLIRQENEALAAGEKVPVLGIDKHLEHINHHKTILSDPTLRRDEQLSKNVLDHIQEHIDQLRTFDPGLLQLIGEQPLGPAGGSPPAPQNPDAGLNQSAPMGGIDEMMQPQPQPAMPNMPQMPQVDANMLPNPQIQQQAMGNVK